MLLRPGLAIILTIFCPLLLAKQLPGASAFSDEFTQSLASAYSQKKHLYKPQTQYMNDEGVPSYTNALILQDSLYLLHHAHNPVNWLPWNEQALSLAAKEDKPVFLSIGYSTCYWCHVMAHESFDNEEIARYLNENFISIKVDRELNPEVDELYLTALMLTQGQAGWPMSHFLTAEGKPFFSGTYYSADEFLELLNNIKSAWHERRDELYMNADKLTEAVQQQLSLASGQNVVNQQMIKKATSLLLADYDVYAGGFGDAAKFPNELSLMFLLQQAERGANEELFAAVENSLLMMAAGGIYDQLAGGFHRYATDVNWLVPHFEKMLYSQANLLRLYIRMYEITGRYQYRRIAEQTIAFVLQDMQSSEGLFYSAIDAASEGNDGLYYTWQVDELSQHLNEADVKFAKKLFGLTEKGNFKHRNILFLPSSFADLATEMNISVETLVDRVDTIRNRLLTLRNQRAAPVVDKKAIVSWNALMISALCQAASVLDDPHYLAAAIKAADFIWQHQRNNTGMLYKIRFNEVAAIEGTLDDYASLAQAFIDLYDVTSDARWLDRALQITQLMLDIFSDDKNGALYFSDGDSQLFHRLVPAMDQVLASGNSTAIRLLTRLSRRIADSRYRQQALKIINTISNQATKQPVSFPYYLLAVDEFFNGEVGDSSYMANGAIKISFADSNDTEAYSKFIDIEMAPGWYIHSNHPLQDEFTPLKITTDRKNDKWFLNAVRYPQAKTQNLPFLNQPLSIFSGSFRVSLDIQATVNSESMFKPCMKLHIHLQACNDQTCLPPESVTLESYPK